LLEISPYCEKMQFLLSSISLKYNDIWKLEISTLENSIIIYTCLPYSAHRKWASQKIDGERVIK